MALVTNAISLLGHAVPGTRSNRLLILIYHRVHSRPDPMFPGEVDTERFDWQMGLLRRFCRPVALEEGVRGLQAGRLPPRAVAVTFDDGYADNATVALPILQRHGIVATFFITPGFLDGGRMWNDSIIEAIRAAGPGHLDLEDFGLGVADLGPEASRGAVAESVIRRVKHLPLETRQRRVEDLCHRIKASLPNDLMMSSSQVLSLARAGMEIGAHTMTHPILRTLTDDAARAEIENSRKVLESIVDRPIRAFAYPNCRPGEDYTDRDRNLVDSLGFEYAVSTRPAAANTVSDRLQLPRFTPWDRTPERWLVRLLLAFGRIA